MKYILYCVVIVFSSLQLQAQDALNTVLQSIEYNNTSLKVLKEQAQAQRLENKTGIYLSNPEIEFGYLWGSPSAIGNRIDLKVTQSFDFPTAYGYRKNISNLQNENIELAYKTERMNLLLSAKQIGIELIYNNALAKEYEKRLEYAERIANAYKIKLEKGDANIIESNKAQLNVTNVRNEVLRIKTEQATLRSELKRLNGGEEIELDTYIFPNHALLANFEDWYALVETKNPVLQYISKQLMINEQQVKLSKAMGLPKFSAGYMSEKIAGEHFQGISIGMSIPLWENKNRTKQAKAQIVANESAMKDNKIQFYNKLKSSYMKTKSLQESANKCKEALSSYNNEILLKKALDMGEISLLTYLLEIEYYYDAVNNLLETEKESALAAAELFAVEL